MLWQVLSRAGDIELFTGAGLDCIITVCKICVMNAFQEASMPETFIAIPWEFSNKDMYNYLTRDSGAQKHLQVML